MNRRIVFSGTLVASLVCASCFAQVKGGAYVPQTQTQNQTQAQTRSQTQTQSQKQDQARSDSAQTGSPIVFQASQDVEATSQTYGPINNWKVGDSWEVETKSLEEQGNTKSFGNIVKIVKIVRWVFTVQKIVSILGKTAFEVSIYNKDRTNSDPAFYMYVDARTGALIRTTNSVWRLGSWRTRTENYASNGATPTATVVPSMPAVPVDMPVFPDAYAKALDFGSGSFVATSETPEDSGAKSTSTVAPFTYRVKQRIEPITNDFGAKLVSKGFDAQTLENAVEVNIESGGRRVKQIWTSSAPWPTYSTNGVVESRLIVDK